MKNLVIFLLCLSVVLLPALSVSAAVDAESMLPFWSSKVIYNEAILPHTEKGTANDPANVKLPLLFTPIEILSVKDALLEKKYIEGVDYTFEDGELKLTANTSIPYMTYEELNMDGPVRNNMINAVDGGYLYSAEGSFFHTKQIAVTYTCAENEWDGIVPSCENNQLPKTMEKLENAEPLTVVLYGDSISEGYNASAFVNTPPYLDSWGALFTKKLQQTYKSDINFINTALAGQDSTWGLTNIAEKVTDYNPDLVVVAFGMNDNTIAEANLTTFENNMRGIVDAIQVANSGAEIMLVSPMIQNPLRSIKNQERDMGKIQPILQEIASDYGTGVQLIDMTTTHKKILETKRFADTTGNNANHPNDYLIRWYAQMLYYTLAPIDEPHLIFDTTFEDNIVKHESLAGDITSNTRIINAYEEPNAVTVVNALYNADNRLVDINCKKITIDALETINDSTTITITEDGEKYTVKTLLLSDLQSMKPMNEIESKTYIRTHVETIPDVNFALKSNGATALASSTSSSGFHVDSVIDGDVIADNWGTLDGWNDATQGIYPDTVTIMFDQAHIINQLDVYTLGNAVPKPGVAPTKNDTFTKNGITDFHYEYYDGREWKAIPGAAVEGNNHVWVTTKFEPVTAEGIRIVVTNSLTNYSRIIELEAKYIA